MKSQESTERRHQPAPSKLGGLRATIITAQDEEAAFLTRELQRLRVTTRNILPSDEPLPNDTDVVFVDYDPCLPQRISWMSGEGAPALVVILPQAATISVAALTAITPQAALARPFTANAIIASMIVARAKSTMELNLRTKAHRLEDTLRSAMTIERAKAMLMSSRGISDEDAYKHMRSQAMVRRVSVGSFAAAIVSSFEILGNAAS